jgi:hypothetical protein
MMWPSLHYRQVAGILTIVAHLPGRKFMDPDFEKAAEEARRAYSADAWANLLPHERSKAIYGELRRIDMARMAAKPSAPLQDGAMNQVCERAPTYEAGKRVRRSRSAPVSRSEAKDDTTARR